ncbi:MAG: hypothetical protein L0229_13160 [Blastocatellia bacterium]|nr:hypothetical protein [Blastocatellia bacterium]
MEKEQEIRLRQQIEELVRSRLTMLEQDISRLQREVSESFTVLLERTDAAATMPEADAAISHIIEEVVAQISQAKTDSARSGADIALLRDSVSAIEGQGTQAEVLNALVARAESFAPRVVLFVVKGDSALAWAAHGFDHDVGNTAIRGLSVSLKSDTALRAAFDSKQTFYGPSNQQSENPTIFQSLGGAQPQRVLTVPLQVRGKSAAVFYADSADQGDEAVKVEAIELLVYTTGLVVELVSLRTRMAGGAQAARQAAAAPGKAPSPGGEQESTSGPLSAPSGPLVSPSGAISQTQPGAPAYFKPAAEPPQPVEHAAAPVPEPAPQEPQQAASPEIAVSGLSEDEEKQHNDARRFARLLVSEIKLYNEQKVVEGRRNSDLYGRLKEDIDRSRQMYDKRVMPAVAAKFDYFYDELVHTLADGDPARLGSHAPGPAVSV